MGKLCTVTFKKDSAVNPSLRSHPLQAPVVIPGPMPQNARMESRTDGHDGAQERRANLPKLPHRAKRRGVIRDSDRLPCGSVSFSAPPRGSQEIYTSATPNLSPGSLPVPHPWAGKESLPTAPHTPHAPSIKQVLVNVHQQIGDTTPDTSNKT